MKSPSHKSDAEYEAEDDARTLARAEELRTNKPRLEKALKAASRLKDEQEKVLKRWDGVLGKSFHHVEPK